MPTRRGGWLRDPIRGLHVARDCDQVHDGRYAAQGGASRRRAVAVLLDHARRGAREDDSHRRLVRLTEEVLRQAEGPEDHRDVRDAGRGEVLVVFLQLPDLHDPGTDVPGGGTVYQGARD